MPETPSPSQVEVVIEIPRWSFLKRGGSGVVDFVSPFPCPFNYGAVPGAIGGDGDLLDAVVLGKRLPRGAQVTIAIQGAIGFTDRGLYDDKLICGPAPLSRWQRCHVLLFFRFYALCKRGLNLWRGRPGRTACEDWADPAAALARARSRGTVAWTDPPTPY